MKPSVDSRLVRCHVFGHNHIVSFEKNYKSGHNYQHHVNIEIITECTVSRKTRSTLGMHSTIQTFSHKLRDHRRYRNERSGINRPYAGRYHFPVSLISTHMHNTAVWQKGSHQKWLLQSGLEATRLQHFGQADPVRGVLERLQPLPESIKKTISQPRGDQQQQR